jgi:predicted dehydrogenase
MLDIVVAGLGRMGAQYSTRANDAPRNHVDAILGNPDLHLTGIADPNARAREILSRRQELAGVSTAESIDALPCRRCDIVVLSTPPEHHSDALQQALALEPRVVIIEKPLALDLPTAQQLLKAAANAGVELRVNFNRALDSGHVRARATLEQLQPNSVRSVLARYSGGWFNYGAHLVDWLLDWFGNVESINAFPAGMRGQDPLLSVRIRMRGGFDAWLIGVNNVGYDLYECEVLTAGGRLELACGGVERRTYTPKPDLHYDNYTQLQETAADIGIVAGLPELYSAVSAHLKFGAKLGGCGPERALAGMAILEAACASADAGGASMHPTFSLSPH